MQSVLGIHTRLQQFPKVETTAVVLLPFLKKLPLTEYIY